MTLRKRGQLGVGWEKLVAIFILLAAFFLFMHNLTAEGLWRDEGLSYARASQPILQIFKNQNVVQGTITPDLHPPGYFLLLKGMMFLAGKSEFALRLPSVFAAVLAVALFGRFAFDLNRRKPFSAVIPMLVIASSPYVYWYAREARMYSLLIFGIALFYWRLSLLLGELRLGQAQFTADWLPLILAGLLVLATHISAIFVIPFAIAILFLLTPSLSWRIPIVMTVTAVIGLVFVSLTEWGQTMLTSNFDFFSPRSFGKLLYETTTTFTLGGASPPAAVWPNFAIFLALALVGCFALISKFVPDRSDRKWGPLAVTILAIFVPLLLFYISSFIQPSYSNPRHLTILFVPWFMLISLGVLHVGNRFRFLGLLLCALVVSVSGFTLASRLAEPPIVKDQLREMRAYLDERILPGDTLLFHEAALTVPWEYYAVDGVRVIAFPGWAVPTDSPWELEIFKDEIKTTGRIWFIDSFGKKSNVKDWLYSNWYPQKPEQFEASWTNYSIRLFMPPELGQAPLETHLINEPIVVDDVEFERLVANNPAVSGNHFWVSGRWSNRGGEKPACLELKDEADQFIVENCHFIAPSAQGTISFNLDLPPGLQAGSYKLRLEIANQLSDPIEVDVSGVQLDTADAILQDGDFYLFQPEVAVSDFHPSTWVVINAIWQLDPNDTAQTRSLDTSWRLHNRQTGDVIDLVETISVDQIATLQPLNFLLPPDAEGSYRLQYQPTFGRWRTITTIEVNPWPFVDQLPDDLLLPTGSHLFADSIQLAGYRFDRQGDRLDVTLFWQADRPPTDDWIVFIHVGEAGQPPVAQAASRPVGSVRPTAGWRAGEIIEDHHILTLPADLNADQSNIFVGLFLGSEPNPRAPLTINGEAKPDGLLFIDEVRLNE